MKKDSTKKEKKVTEKKEKLLKHKNQFEQGVRAYVNGKFETSTKLFEEVYKIAGNKIIYNERFANPFEYIDVEDIADDYSLDLVKATYIVESFTSLQYAV